MKNLKTLFQEVVAAIHLSESSDEIRSIAYILIEKKFGAAKTDIMAGKGVPFPPDVADSLKQDIERINRGEPVQYIVGEEIFFGRSFLVNPSVLIPRPETEELVRVVLDYANSTDVARGNHALRILDIGTGSGCIPITLFLELAKAEVYGTDISTAALAVAATNAQKLQARVTFLEHNILKEKLPLSLLDVIVSNPPYITEPEKAEINSNVIDYEPHLALFVPGEDPLEFYRAIVQRAGEALKTNGLLAVEINEKFGEEVSRLFRYAGFEKIATLKDVAGKERVVRGLRHGKAG